MRRKKAQQARKEASKHGKHQTIESETSKAGREAGSDGSFDERESLWQVPAAAAGALHAYLQSFWARKRFERQARAASEVQPAVRRCLVRLMPASVKLVGM